MIANKIEIIKKKLNELVDSPNISFEHQEKFNQLFDLKKMGDFFLLNLSEEDLDNLFNTLNNQVQFINGVDAMLDRMNGIRAIKALKEVDNFL